MPARNPRVSYVPLIMVGVGLLLIVASLLWFANATSKPAVSETQAIAPAASPRIPYPDIQRIRLGDAKAALDLQQAIFIDTRGEPYFSQGHIPGALSMTSDEAEARLKELDPNAWIITYCT